MEIYISPPYRTGPGLLIKDGVTRILRRKRIFPFYLELRNTILRLALASNARP